MTASRSSPSSASSGQRAGNPARLLRRLSVPRWHLPVLLGVAAATAAAIIAQAELLATAITGLDATVLPWLAGVVTLRAALAGLARGLSGHESARARHRLRGAMLRATRTRNTTEEGSHVTLVTRGVDALDAYLTGYVSQYVTAAVLPLAVLGWLAYTDLASALIVLVTLPLLPVLGALVGWHTVAATRHRWRAMDRLGGHFLDALCGLATLRSFGRDQHQIGEVHRSSQAHRRASMSVLRIAFLSAMVLELVAALAVALVAVPMGMRLLEGGVSLQVGLVVLLLTPEAFLPLRALGSAFHTATDGMEAADRALRNASPDDDRPDSRRPIHTAKARLPDAASAEIRLEQVTVRFPGRAEPALDRVSLSLAPEQSVALGGPSGAGKSTLLRLLVGLVCPSEGRMLVDGVELATLDLTAWRSQLAWIPQHPHLFTDTLAANVALRPGLTTTANPQEENRLRRALDAAGAAELLTSPGLDTVLGARRGVSAGQLQRIALARAHYRDAALVLLDEPTTRLDLASEAVLRDAIHELGRTRRTVTVAHSPALLAAAEHQIWLDAGRITAEGRNHAAAAPPAKP